MRLASRVESLPPSSTLAVTARAKELAREGVDVISFAAGEPDFSTPQMVVEAAVSALRGGQTRYGPVPGDPESRRVIAEKLTRENRIPGVTADHVVISSGGKHSLALLFQALIDAEAGMDEVLLPVPAWVSYAPMTTLAGGRVVEIPTTSANDFKMTPGQLERAITSRSRILVINSPSNPCGTMYSPEELRAFAQIIADAARTRAPDLVVISDELYEKIVFGGIDHFSIGSVPAIADRTITVNGLSKAYAMTGWRVGYFAGSGAFGLKVAKGVAKLQSQSTTSIPTFIMPAVTAALTKCEGEVARMREAFAARATIAYSLVAGIPGVVCPQPTGAFYLFPDVSAHFGKKSAQGREITWAAAFAEALLEEQRVAVVPGEDFGSGGEKCFRLTFACDEKSIREGIGRIRAFVEGLR